MITQWRGGADPERSLSAFLVPLRGVRPEPLNRRAVSSRGGLTNDILIHTWDLATATGQQVTLDPALVESAHAGLVAAGDFVRAPNIFGPAVEPPVGADAQTKLLCFAGRRAG